MKESATCFVRHFPKPCLINLTDLFIYQNSSWVQLKFEPFLKIRRPPPLISADRDPTFEKPLLNQSRLKSSGIDLIHPSIIILFFLRLIIIFFLFHLIFYSLPIFFCFHFSSSSSFSLILPVFLLYEYYSSFPLVRSFYFSSIFSLT